MKYHGKESGVLHAILKGFSNGPTRLFRNNVGLFQTADGRKVMTGLCKGSSDIIGWTSVTVTENMVGHKLAVFTAIEVKGPRGRPTKEQVNFIEQVQNAGGLAQICFSTEDVKKLLASVNKYDIL